MEEGCNGCDGVGGSRCRESYSPASRLRRRCRSEGLERSPYDQHAPAQLFCAEGIAHRGYQNHPFNKSPFVVNREDWESYVHITNFPPSNGVDEYSIAAQLNGDLMGKQRNRNPRSSPTRSTRYRKESPTKAARQNSPLARIDRDDRLPKVEELLEKLDHSDFMDYTMEPIAKQPLKSILNNPRKSPPPGILKKKCKNQEERPGGEGRRRQRALSESEYHYTNYEGHRSFHESRIQCALSNMKRMKDNSGTMSYGGHAYDCRRHHTSPSKLQGSPRLPGSPNLQGSPNFQGSPKVLGSPKVQGSPRVQGSPKRQASPKRHPSPKLQAGPKPLSNTKSHPAPQSDWVNDVRPQEASVLRTTSIGVWSNMDIILPPPPPVLAPPPPPLPLAPSSASGSSPASRTAKKAPRSVRKGKPKSRSRPMKSKKIESGDADLDECGEGMSPPCAMETECAGAVPESAGAGPECAAWAGETSEQASVRHLSDQLTNGAVVTHKATRELTSPIPDGLSSCVRPSLFPRVPPYLKFIGHDATPPLKPPLALARHLKWKLTSITPIVVKKTLVNSGFRLVKSDCDTAESPQDETVDWIGIWGKHMKSLMFRAIKDGQKMNHFPGTFQIGRKDRLWRNLQKLAAKHGTKEFGIMPKTYVLPHDMKILKREWEKYAARNEKWIIKPPASARGTGIAVVSRWAEIPKKRAVVVQRYVSKPYLINGSKFDLRLYVLVTSVHPLKIYLFNDGLARFASVKYTEEVSSLHDRYMHLTNYSINRLSKNYAQNEDASACQGHKWTLQTLLQYLERERSVDTIALWESMKELVIKTIVSGESSIRSLTETNVTSRYNCYELFGIDVLLDEDLKPWLLEVNISPSLHSSSPLDLHVKGPLVTAVLNMAQFHVPGKANLDTLADGKNGSKLAGVAYDPRLYTVYLSKEERDKHIIYTKMEDREEYVSDILSTLTPDDVRHLLQAEDELAAGACAAGRADGLGMERIFPTRHTHKYLDFLASPRYYNRLLDAWECKYSRDRTHGINLLRSLCEIGYHLEVPPVPLKRAAAPELACLVDACRVTRTIRRPALNTRRCRSRWSRRPPAAAARTSAASGSRCRRSRDAGA